MPMGRELIAIIVLDVLAASSRASCCGRSMAFVSTRTGRPCAGATSQSHVERARGEASKTGSNRGNWRSHLPNHHRVLGVVAFPASSQQDVAAAEFVWRRGRWASLDSLQRYTKVHKEATGYNLERSLGVTVGEDLKVKLCVLASEAAGL
mgnify:CR=1 FL=1